MTTLAIGASALIARGRVPALGQRAALLRQHMVDQRLELRAWTWPAG